jgi:engulfment/cell motility protein 1
MSVASAILKKLVEADPRRTPDLISCSGSRNGPLVPQLGSVYRFSFDVAWEEMKREQGLLDIVVNQLVVRIV